MKMRENRFKTRLKAGEVQYGIWAMLCSTAVTEIMGGSAFDWVLIDTEHAPNELPGIIDQIRALDTTDTPALVRPAWNDTVLIKRLLDSGAESFIIPFVQTAEEARAAVAATRYPPQGVRGVAGVSRNAGYGRVATYLQEAADHIAVVVQIESREAMANLEEILAVEGVDAIFVGPADLAASMGHLGNPGHPEVQAAIAEIAERVKAANGRMGIFTGGAEDAARAAALGYHFMSVGADVMVFTRAIDALAAQVKG
ncbi:HpcH/HpaI aldolase/citrate lyase family protein [Oceanicella sp. SM1341]|uniref:HpcH/HpaI aldolase family protein n=1 Tax=Oceanicella sp. SM1341 TaxID=1548889 RepID=UPI000E51990F|nr:HpcH/HpaI aldolase/citrate lyase family protein [Oceanicella sp. SM1341]